MLKDPFLNERFDPSLKWFIGVFDVYDREQELGAKLKKYNPDNKADREELIRNYALDLPYLSYRHKYLLIRDLESKLKEKNYNFQNLFEIAEDETGSWPRAEWYNLENPRDFFEALYLIAQTAWKDDLQKASLEDPTTW